MKDIVLIEAASKNTYQRKYKCPYCEQKYERSKLHIHIQNKHEDLIPEGYTALRVAFNIINNKTEGHCIMCGKVSDWNENKGRYERLCNDPKCHEAYKRMAAERNKKKYGAERLQSDPRYAEEVQRKALQGRRIAGKYKFADGGEIEYLGAYERRFLEFMDKIMNCKSEDIAAPGPTIKYIWNGAEHLYISDFYYIPYNLIVEIKDGGDNPNNNPAMRGYKTDRQEAKEAAVKATEKYNYIRQTNNDFGQLMSIMAVLKYNLQNECYDPVMRINEMTLLESVRGNKIYYGLTEKEAKQKKLVYKGNSKFTHKGVNTTLFGLKKFVKDNNLEKIITKYTILDRSIFDIDESVNKDDKYDMIAVRFPFEFDITNVHDLNLSNLNESTILNEALSINDFLKENNINNAQDLYNWMHKNIKYKSNGIYHSPEEVINFKFGDCHDQAELAKVCLTKLGYIAIKVFMVEYYDYSKPGGKTHTLTVFAENKPFNINYKWYWFENAWGSKSGIHKLQDSLLPKEIYSPIFKAWDWSGRCDKLYWTQIRKDPKYGCDLGEYVGQLTPEKEPKKNIYYKDQSLNESILFNEKDIYYNKDKFDSGEINLCFITGHSGSGKSTMARDMQKDNVEHYELDDLQCIKDHFTMAQLKEYGDLIYSYFNGPGKKFYITWDELKEKKIPGSEYEDKLFPGFVYYAMQYAKSHKDKKYVIEGVWLYDRDESGQPWFKPEEFKDYAFYIKGTSLIISKYRAAKRDAKLDNDKQVDILRYTAKGFFKNWKWYFIDEKQINRFRDYFKKMNINEVTEDMSGTIGAALPTHNYVMPVTPTPAPTPYESDPENYYIVTHPKDNKLTYSITKDPLQYSLYSVDPQEKGFYKVFKSDKGKIDKRYLTFKIKDKQKAKELYESLEELYNRNLTFTENGLRSDQYPDFIYSYLTDGSIIKTYDQILFDNRFELVSDFDTSVNEMSNNIYNYLKNGVSNIDTLQEQVKELEGIIYE